MKNLFREFRPAILFISKFLLIYLIGNLLYGLYVSSFRPRPDPITDHVSIQTAWLLSATGWDSTSEPETLKPTTNVREGNRNVIAIYEGCNGLNVMIIFVAFVMAFGPWHQSGLWFIPLGLVVIHLANLARLYLLFLVSLKMPHYLYFTHKYLFTAFIYLVTLLLWMVWVKMALRLKQS